MPVLHAYSSLPKIGAIFKLPEKGEYVKEYFYSPLFISPDGTISKLLLEKSEYRILKPGDTVIGWELMEYEGMGKILLSSGEKLEVHLLMPVFKYLISDIRDFKLAHKIKVQARNSNNTELIELASKVGEEYGKIKFRYIELRGNELLRKIIANEFLIATENLIDKLRTL